MSRGPQAAGSRGVADVTPGVIHKIDDTPGDITQPVSNEQPTEPDVTSGPIPGGHAQCDSPDSGGDTSFDVEEL